MAKGFNLSSQLILLPDLAESGDHPFSEWFKDSTFTNQFTSSAITTDITLYGGWGYTISFDATGGIVTPSSRCVLYGLLYGYLPTPKMTGHIFLGWFTEGNTRITSGMMVSISSNHTLYARWVLEIIQ